MSAAQVQKLESLLGRVQERRNQPRPARAAAPAARPSRPSKPQAPTPLEEAVQRESDKPPVPEPEESFLTPVPDAAPVPVDPAPSLPPAPVQPEPLELGDLEATGPTPVSVPPPVEAISLPIETDDDGLELDQPAAQEGPSATFEPKIPVAAGSPVKQTSAAVPAEVLTFGGLLELSLSLRPKE